MPAFVYGAGAQPAGWTPPSAYYPVAQGPAPVVFRDPITGASQPARLIDPNTRQFVYDASGLALGMPAVSQCVLIAWGTVKLAPAIPTFVAGWQNKVQALYTSAVRYLIQNKLMSITSFQLTRFGSNGVVVNITWKDLTTGIEYPYKVPG